MSVAKMGLGFMEAFCKHVGIVWTHNSRNVQV